MHKSASPKAVIYARQSLTREGSESLDTQVDACQLAAKRLGCHVEAVLVEPPSTSGYKHRGTKREKFKELLDGFAAGRWQVVIAYKTDRLSRGGGPGWAPLVDAIESAGLNIDRAVATPSGYVSEFEIGIRATMDREESKKTSERLTDIASRKAAAGKPHGSRRAYGYESDLVTIREEEAVLLRLMAEKVMAGWSYKEVAWYMNEQGHKTTLGKLFYPVTIRNMLLKDRYAGLREYNGATYPAVWPAIFDAETWQRLQLTMKLRRDRANSPHGYTYLLTGLAYCGECGQSLNGSAKQDRPTAPKRRTYICRVQGDTQRKHGCGKVRRGAEALEHFITECVIFRLDSPELGKLLADKAVDDGVLSALLEKRASQQQVIDALVDDYATGLLTRSEFARAKQAAQAELVRIEREISQQSRSTTASRLLPVGETVRQAIANMTTSQRRDVFSMLIERIVVEKSSLKPFYYIDGKTHRFDPESITIHWKV